MTEIPDDLLLIGVIAGPFGIKGLVKLKAFTDQPDYLKRHLRDVFREGPPTINRPLIP